MNTPELTTWLRAELLRLGSEAGRAAARRFFREPVDPYGVGAVEVKKLAREAARVVRPWTPAERNRLCTGLMQGGKLEEPALVAYLYERFARQCGRCEFKLFERWVERWVSNWAACDAISTRLVAASIANEPALASELLPWTASKNRWKRRAAAVSLVKEARRGRQTAAIFSLSTRLMLDDDEMVQKGAGWLLKETYPLKPIETVRFLNGWKDRAPRLTLRYAAEKMTAADRRKVLGR